MWRGLVVGALIAGTTTCTSGPPPGYSGGAADSWTFPLVGPLEGGLLLVPVTVNDKGPFLFALDPDAVLSVMDEEVIKEARMRTDRGDGPRMVDESDTSQIRFFAEALSYEIGPLVVQGAKPTLVVKSHTYDVAGRRVYGLIGHDILVDSLAFSFDRDLGLATLTVQDNFKPPHGATEVHYTLLPNRMVNRARPLSRRVTKVLVNGQLFTMHLDLGGTVNMLRESLWPKADLTATDREGSVIDEIGSVRATTKVATTNVSLGGETNDHALFVTYVDKRWDDEELDGTLALDFFKPYRVSVSWDKQTFYLAPRQDTESAAKQRLGRWSDFGGIAKCEHVGCVTVKLIDPLASKAPTPAHPVPAPAPAAGSGSDAGSGSGSDAGSDTPAPPTPEGEVDPKHPGLVLSVVRDPVIGGMEFEVVLAAANNKKLPWLVVNMPGSTDRVLAHLSPEWVGATLTVIDDSPYPRKCTGGGSCIDQITP